jgi:hypothetical protein
LAFTAAFLPGFPSEKIIKMKYCRGNEMKKKGSGRNEILVPEVL